MVGNVQWREEIVQRRKAFDMLLLTDKQVSERGCIGSRSQMQGKRCVPEILDSSGLPSRNLFLVRELR